MAYQLSEEASADVHEIIGWVADEHGDEAAHRLFEALDEKFEAIGAGLVVGHVRRDVQTIRAVRFTKAGNYMITFDPETNEIVRVVHGARDFPTVFAGL